MARWLGQAMIAGRWPTFLFLTIIFFIANQGINLGSGQVVAPSAQEIAQSTAGAGSLERQISLVVLAAFGLLVVLRQRRTAKVNGALGWLIVSFVVWNFASLAWADDKVMVSKRLCIFAALCLGALAVNKVFSLRDIARLCFVSCSTTLLIGFLVEVAHGEFQPFHAGYRFSGMIHPNAQGWNCAFLFFSGIALGRQGQKDRRFFFACSFVGLLFLILTRSRGAWAALLLSMAMLSSAGWTRVRKLLACYMAVLAFVLALLFAGDAWYPTLRKALLLGRDDESVETLNGRASVWDEALSYAARRPIQGYGYNGFWTPRHELDISEVAGWGVADAHNGYLDLVLGVGIVGTAIYVTILLLGIARSLLLFRRRRNDLMGFALAVLIFYAVVTYIDVISLGPTIPTFVVFLLLLKLGFRMGEPKLQTLARKRNSTRIESQSPDAGVGESPPGGHFGLQHPI